jgi:hypothetical protein
MVTNNWPILTNTFQKLYDKCTIEDGIKKINACVIYI